MFNATIASAQNNITKSPALELLYQQIQKGYVPQKWKAQLKWDMDSIAKVIPPFYVKIVGYAMFNQKKKLKQNSIDSKAYDNLNDEILSIIPKIANAYNEANYNNNKFQNPDWLKGHYLNATKGGLDKEFRQSYNKHAGKEIAQINFPYVLNKEQEPAYKKAARKNDAIVLLGVSPLPESSRKELGEPIKLGLKCPLKGKKLSNYSGYTEKIDTNDNPNDKTYIECGYRIGQIFNQTALVNGYKHGEYFGFHDSDEDGDLPNILHTHGYYNNGKKDGIWEEYWYYEKSGKTLLRERTTYDNGIKLSEEEYYTKNGKRDIYLEKRSLYVNGRRSETTWYYENTRKRMHVTVDTTVINGKSVKDGCWKEDGTSFPCPSYW